MSKNTLRPKGGRRHPVIRKNLKLLLLAYLLGWSVSGFGQESFTILNMMELPQASYINPALTPTHLRFFIGIPGLSALQANGNSQGFQLSDLGLDRLFNASINFTQARDQVSDLNAYRFDNRLDLLYGGIAAKSGFFTFNFTERIIGDTWLPRTFFARLADEDTEEPVPGKMYDLGDLMARAMHFKELGIGYSTQNRKGVSWGVRLKFLLGHEALYSDNTGLVLVADEEGGLQTDGSLMIRTAGFSHFQEGESLFRLFSAKNAGVAIDGGLNYQYNKQWSFFAGIRDLGGITWRRALNEKALATTFTDLGEELENTIEGLIDDLPEMPGSFRVSLPPSISGGVRYHLKNGHRLNAMASSRFYRQGTKLGLSLGYYAPITSWLDATLNYAMYNGTYDNVGAGMAVQLGKIQLYFASDNILSVCSPTRYNNYHFQTGIQLIWEKPDKNNRRPTAKRESPDETIATMGQRATEAPLGDYFTLSGSFISEDEQQAVDAIYVDIYRFNGSGEKELIHTSRYPGNAFEVTLFRTASLHEMTVRAYGFEPLVFQFVPDSEDIERNFKLIPAEGNSGE